MTHPELATALAGQPEAISAGRGGDGAERILNRVCELATESVLPHLVPAGSADSLLLRGFEDLNAHGEMGGEVNGGLWLSTIGPGVRACGRPRRRQDEIRSQ